MRFAEINRRFTEKVAKYINNGWTINTASMSGSQGEVARIDITDGNRIIRVMLTKISGSSPVWYEGYKISVGLAKRTVKPNDMDTWKTIWNGDLEELESESFYQAGIMSSTDWFVSKNQMITNYEKMTARYYSKYMADSRDITEKAAKVVLPFVKRQNRCKGAKLQDIKVERNSKGFTVMYKNNSWTLK